MQGLGPNALVTVAGGPAGGGNLIAASTLNAEPTPWHLTQLGGTSTAGDALLERGNEITGDLYGFIARQQPAESFRLHQFSSGAIVAQAWKTAPGVPAGADWTTGQFTATVTKREYLFWQSGQPTLNVRTFDQATAPPDFNAGTDFDLGQAIDEVAVLTSTTPPRLLVIFAGGTSAGVFDFDGVNAPVLAHTLTPEPGQTFRNALAANGGDFHLLSGAVGSPTSDSARRWRRQPNGSYIADPASPMPVLRPGSRRANLLLYVGEPFVDDNARLVSALSTRDWTTAANGIPGMIQATAEIFQSSTAGLGQPASVSLGASSYGPTHALPSQYADDVSISLNSAPVGLIGPELRLSPPPGRYASTLNVSIIADGLTPAMQVLYRTDPAQPWQSYDAATRPPIAITGTTQLQAYAVSGGAAITPIVGGMYFIGTGSSPAVPFTLAATAVTATSAMLNASVDPNGSATTAFFDYGTSTTAPGTSTTGQAIGSGDIALPVSTEVTGLQAHTTYHFRAKATSAEGTNLGQRLTFTTANRPPVFADASFNGSEDTPVTDTLSATDPDSDALTFTLLTSASNGALVVNANGSFTFTPTANYHGTTSFTVKAADAFGGEDTATITLVIAPVNDVPVALAQTLAGFRDTPLTINLTADDEEGGPFTLWEILTPPAHGTLSSTAPYLEYTPAANYSGPDSLTFRVKDEGPAFSNSAVVTIQISPNSPPGNVRTWVGGTTGLWSDNVSWDPAYVPTSQDRVIVNSLDRANLNVDARVGQLDLSGQIEGTHHLQADLLNFMAASLGTNAKTLTGGTFTAYDVRVAHFMVLDAAVLNSTSSLFGVGNPGFPDPSITLELKNGSTLNNSGTMGLNNDSNITGSGGANRFNNSGTFTHSRNPQYISDLDVSVEITNSGTFRQESGTIYMQGSHPFRQTAGELFVKEFCGMYSDGPILIEGGKVTGGGQLHASAVTVTDGTLAPGGQGSFDRRGQLRISNLSLSAQSKLSIDIGDSSSDLIEAWTASAPLERNGNLEIFFVEGAHISVQPSQSFTILTCYQSGTGSPQTTTGQFSNVVAGRVDTADGFGSFAVNAAGTSSVVLSDFQPYPFFQWYVDLTTYNNGIRKTNTPSGESLNWGVRRVNLPAPPATIVINNAGRAPLTGISATVTGTHASEFVITTPPGASSLNPGQSTSFVITFTPTAQGDRTAMLEMTSNDPQTPTVLVELRGRGNTSPVLNLPASPLIVDATSQYGAYADFTVSATDIDDTSPPIAIATPASGTYFLMGDTVVNVSATDASGATTTGSFIVRVRFPPPQLGTLAPTPVTHTAATLRGTVTPRGGPTSVFFEYGLTTSYGSTTATQYVGEGFSPIAVSASIPDLQPQTPYHCRLVAISAFGTFTGNDMPFTTQAIAAPPIPGNDSYSLFANEILYLNNDELMVNDLRGPSNLPIHIIGTSNPVNCTADFFGSYIFFLPDLDFTGVASFTYTVANELGGTATATVTVQVMAPPVQPTLIGGSAVGLFKNGISSWLGFSVGPAPSAEDITVTVSSSNPGLLPITRIDMQGTGSARQIRLRPICEATGQAVITLTATSIDNLTATTTFHLNVINGANAQLANLTGLGTLPQENSESYASSGAADVSADGSVIVGASYGRPSGPFIWTPTDGMTALREDPNLFSHQVTSVSEDGLVVAGSASSAEGQRGFLWTSLDGYLALPPDTQVHDISADGSIAVGFRQTYTPTFELITDPIRWTAAGGVTTLAIPAGFIETRATGISSDGSTIIGYGTDSSYTMHAVVWPMIGPPIILPALPGAGYTRAHDISADGSVIVGFSTNSISGQNDAVRWTRGVGGAYTLASLVVVSDVSTEATGVSADGTKIVGFKSDVTGPFLWDATNGMRTLGNLLLGAGVDASIDWTSLGQQAAISADGKFIVGTGYRQGTFRSEAWRIELPRAPAGPVISPISNLSTNADTATPAIPFTLSDPDSNPECLVLTVDSSNPTLVPLANIVFGGSGASRTVTVTPAAGQSGTALIVITVNDGFTTSMEDFTLTVGPGNLAPTALPQTVSTNEDNAREITPTGTDPEGQPLTFSIVTQPDVAKGEVILLDNKFHFYPAENFHGSATFTFRAYDGMAYSAPATITVNVMPLNDDPVAVDKQFTIDEDTPLPLVGLASDVDGDPLVLYEQDTPLHGTISGDWPDLTYTPDANFHGADSFTYLVSDGLLDSEIKTVTITINPVNDAPIVANRNVQTPEDTALPITLTATDPEGEVITFVKLTDPAHGSLTIAGNVFTYTPDADYHGPDSFTWKARDSNNADSLTASVSITVAPMPELPLVKTWNADHAHRTGAELHAFVHPKAEETTVWFEYGPDTNYGSQTPDQTLPAYLTAWQPIDAKLTGMPPGTYHFRIVAETAAGVVHGEDRVIKLVDYALVTWGQPYLGGVTSVGGSASAGVVSASCGVHSDVFIKSDGTLWGWGNSYSLGLSDSFEHFTVLPPVQIGTRTDWKQACGSHEMGASFIALASDGTLWWMNDNNSAPRTLVQVGMDTDWKQVTAGAGYFMAIKTNGTLWAWGYNPFGQLGDGTTSSRSHPVQIGNDTDWRTLPVGSYSFGASAAIKNDGSLWAWGLNIAGQLGQGDTTDSLVPVRVGTGSEWVACSVSSASLYAVKVDGTRWSAGAVFLGPPDGGFSFSNVLVQAVDDPAAAALVGSFGAVVLGFDHTVRTYQTNTPQTFSFFDVPPIVKDVQSVSMGYHQIVALVPSSPAPITLAATNVTTSSATLNGTVDPNGVASSAAFDLGPTTAYGTSTGAFNVGSGIGPVAHQETVVGLSPHTTYHFRIKGSSSQGTEYGQDLTFTTGNSIPVFADASFDGFEDIVLNNTLVGTDADGDALSFTKLTDPANGDLTVNPNGSFTYTPDLNWFGTDSFTAKVVDGFGGEDTATITLVIAPVNDAPLPQPQNLATAEDTPLPITLTATDAENDPITWQIMTPPTYGELSGDAPNLIYTPDPNFHGNDQLFFRASDAMGGNSAFIYLTVTPVDDPPVVANRSIELDEDVPTTVILNATDPEGDAYALEILSGPAQGQLSGAPPSPIYFPPQNFSGTTTFTYRAVSAPPSGLVSNTGTITLIVRPVNDPPFLDEVNFTTNEDTALPITLTATDAEGDTPSFAITQPPVSKGVVTGISPNFTFTPAENFYGLVTVPVLVTDDRGASNPSAIHINVLPVNDLPVAQNATFTIDEDTVLNNAVAGSDVDGLELEFEPVAQPAHGTLSLQDNGNFTYTPALNFNGQDTFTYRILDEANAPSNTATVTINVTPVNDPPVALAGSFTTAEDTAFTGALLGSDPDGDPLTFGFFTFGGFGEIGRPAHGNITLNTATGAFTYTPQANYHGPDEIRFQVREPGGNFTNVATVAITVTNTDDGPPLANEVTLTGKQDTPITGYATATSPDGYPVSYTKLTDPAHGTATIHATTGLISYTPTNGFHGMDTFTYKASDLEGDSRSATIQVRVRSATGRVLIRGSYKNNSGESIPPSMSQGIVSMDVSSACVAALTSTGGVVTDTWSYDVPATPPVPQAAQSGVTAVAAGHGGSHRTSPTTFSSTGSHFLAVKGGSVIAWGDNTFQQCTIPEAASDGTVIAVAAGKNTSAALRADGRVVAWGAYYGVRPFPVDGPPPGGEIPIPSGAIANVTAISCGQEGEIYAIRSDGNLVSWNRPYADHIHVVTNAFPTALATVVKLRNCGPFIGAIYTNATVAVYGNMRTYDPITGSEVAWTSAEVAPEASVDALDVMGGGVFGSVLRRDGSIISWSKFTNGPRIRSMNLFGDITPARAQGNALAIGAHRTQDPGTLFYLIHENDAPAALPQSITLAKNTSKVITPTGADTTNDSLTFALASQPAHGTAVANANGTFTYTPAADYIGEDSFTFTASEAASTSTPGSITLSILDMDPFAAWQLTHYGSSAGASIASDGDTDGDKRTNLEEFAFGTDPRANRGGDVTFNGGTVTARGSPVTIPAGQLGFSQPMAIFCRRVDWQAAGLTYTVLFSADVINKVPSATTPTVLATDGEIEVVAIPYPATIEVGGQNVVPTFFQVQITRAP